MTRTAHHPQNGERPPKSVDSTGHTDDRLRRSDLLRNAQQVEFFGGGQWREVVSPHGVRCFVTRLWGKEPVAAWRVRFQMPCPTKYGNKEADKDCARLIEFAELRENGAALTEAQVAEEAHLRARMDVLSASPESIARRRRAALEEAERRYRSFREFYAAPLSRKDRDDLRLLRWLYPAEPKRDLSQLDDDGLEMYRDHPFRDELQAPDGNFYPRHSKLRPAGAADDLLAQTGDGALISPVIPCNAPATWKTTSAWWCAQSDSRSTILRIDEFRPACSSALRIGWPLARASAVVLGVTSQHRSVTALRDNETALTEAQKAEEAHLRARFDVFALVSILPPQFDRQKTSVCASREARSPTRAEAA
jgi:hypothetical protein